MVEISNLVPLAIIFFFHKIKLFGTDLVELSIQMNELDRL